MQTFPFEGLSRPARIFKRVDFPEPLLPSIATNSPFWVVTDTPRSAYSDTAFWQYIFEMFSALNTSNFIYLLHLLFAYPCIQCSIFFIYLQQILSKTTISTASKTNSRSNNTGQAEAAPAISSITTGTTYFRGWCHRSLSIFQSRMG